MTRSPFGKGSRFRLVRVLMLVSLLAAAVCLPVAGETHHGENWSFGKVSILPMEPYIAWDLDSALYVNGNVRLACPDYFIAGTGSQVCEDCGFAAIGGGRANTISGDSSYVTISGGESNEASASHATIGGGKEHTATAWATTVAGGARNHATSSRATVGGGTGNTASGVSATVPGGEANVAEGNKSFAAGFGARAMADGSFVWHDATPETDPPFQSTTKNQFLIYASGNVGINTDTPTSALTVEGSIATTSSIKFPQGAILGAGAGALELHANGQRSLRLELVEVSPNVIGGHYGNWISDGVFGATISGGGVLETDPDLEGRNSVHGYFGTVCGGRGNSAMGGCVVSGGRGNSAGSGSSVIAGGTWNETAGVGSAVLGGSSNMASGMYATVLGGLKNNASREYSLVGGTAASALHAGAFVWADGSFSSDNGETLPLQFESQATNEFAVRATGGIRLVTGVNSDGTPVSAGTLVSGATDWSITCDRAAKANISSLDSRSVLDTLSQVPITEWNLITQDPSIRHVGPMAQDFYEAFRLGESELRITGSDLSGIALSSIQALHEISQEQAAEIETLREEIEELWQLVNNLAGGAG